MVCSTCVQVVWHQWLHRSLQRQVWHQRLTQHWQQALQPVCQQRQLVSNMAYYLFCVHLLPDSSVSLHDPTLQQKLMYSPSCACLLKESAPRLRPLQLLLLFASISAVAPRSCPASAAAPRFDCACFSSCSPLASPSAVVPQLHPFRLLLPKLRPPSAWRFSCSSPCPMHSSQSSRFSKLKYEGHVSPV